MVKKKKDPRVFPQQGTIIEPPPVPDPANMRFPRSWLKSEEGPSAVLGTSGKVSSPKAPPTKLTPAQKASGMSYITDREGNEILYTPEVKEKMLKEAEWAVAARGGFQTGETIRISEEKKKLATQLQSQLQQGTISQEGQIDPATGQPIGMMGMMEETPLDWRQVGLATATDPSTIRDIGAGIIAGAWSGGKLGMVLGPKGAIIGAIAGTGLAIYSSIMRNIKSQKSADIAAQQLVLTDGKTNSERLIALMNLDPDNNQMYVEAFNQQMNNIAQAYAQLKLDTQNNLNLALSLDGTRELQRYENFYGAGGGYDYFTTKAQVAVAAPNMDEGMRGLLMSQTAIGTE